MLLRRWLRMPLAHKISLLFGTAVLLTIGVTLVFPWLQMTALGEQTMLLQAKRVATTAYLAVDLHEPRWTVAHNVLEQRWPLLARELDLPPEQPQLVRMNDVFPERPEKALAPARTGEANEVFQRDAMERLRAHPEQRYYWRTQDDGRSFRFAMAVRGGEADPHPHVLRGIIFIHLPVPRAPAAWNSVVTVLAGASGAVLAILMFYLVTQRLVLSPVRALRRVAEKVTRGDTQIRASIASEDEFEDLSEAFNDMLTHLKAAQEEQEKINRSLDIRLGELAETNVGLFESNRLKSEFLANVTHELRSPLISIIGFAELLRDTAGTPKGDTVRMSRYSDNILSSGRGLLDIINDLLDLAKIEAGKLDLHISEFDPAELCRDMMDFVRPLADKREQGLALELGPDLPACRSDAGKIKQILYNLLSNAIKFTPPLGFVSLSVSAVGRDSICLTVRDTGPGIPTEQFEIIFEKFSQLDASKTREHEGTGLGLAITKELVQTLGGEVRTESVVGEGSAFIVELPASLESPTPPSNAEIPSP